MSATTLRLYEATDALETVRAWIDENAEAIIAAGGELPPELAELIDQAEGDFATKVERVALYIRELLASAKAVKEEEDRLAARRKASERAAEGLKRYLLANMERADVPRVEGKLVTVRLQANPPSVKSTLTAEQLRALWGTHGDALVRYIPESWALNPDGVKQLAKAGQPLPEGIAIEQGRHVRIA